MRVLAYAFCSFVGYRVGLDLPAGAFSAYLPVILSYHLFLAFLVISHEQEPLFPLPLFSTVATRLACLGFVIALAVFTSYLPEFGLIRFLIPGLAMLECAFLFSLGNPKSGMESPLLHATVDEYDQFLKLVAQGRGPFMRPGRTVEDAYERWLAHRSRKRAKSRLHPPDAAA